MKSVFIAILLLSVTAVSQQKFKNFSLPDLQGKMHQLSDFTDKKLIIFNFASW